LDITESSKLKLSHLRFQRLLPFHYDSIGQDADTTVMRALRGL
jgi:hypothetical protein